MSHQKDAYSVLSSFDLNGRPLRTETNLGGGASRVEEFEYNQVGFLKQTTVHDLETEGGTSTLVWTNEPDARNRVRVTHTPAPDNKTVTYEFDLRGRTKQITQGDHVESFVYDGNGNLRFHHVGDATEERTYTGHNQVETITDAAQTKTIYGYTKGEVSSTTVLDLLNPSYGALSSVQVPQASRDALGRPTAWTSGGASSSASYPHGDFTTVTTGPRGLQTTSMIDAAGRPATETVSGAGITPQLTAHTYDDPGFRVSMTSHEGDGQEPFGTTSAFDPRGNLEDVLDARNTRLVHYENRVDGALVGQTVSPDDQSVVTAYPVSKLGESLGRETPSVAYEVQLDPARRLKSEGRPGQSRVYGYDDAQRLVSITEPDGTAWSFGNFDLRNQPQAITMPGGSISASYDLVGRLASETVSFAPFTDVESMTYDGFDRVRHAQNAASSLDLSFDAKGVMTERKLIASGATYTLNVAPYDDGTPLLTRYPSGTEVEDERDALGQLRRQVDRTSGVPIVEQVEYAMTGVPGEVVLANGVRRRDTFDHRRRLLGRSYTKAGQVVAELRYAYDGANRETARQAMHEGGRTSFFTYDPDSRLFSAEIDAAPGSGQGEVSQQLIYDTSGADALASVVTVTSPGFSAPDFVESASAFDAFGLPGTIEVGGVSYPQTRDALGNVTGTLMKGGLGTLQYDGLSRLRHIERADGATIDYLYRPDGALLSRNVVCNSALDCEPGKTSFVYDGLLLRETYNTTGATPVLTGRYYYADEADIPVAADLADPVTHVMRRVYFVADRMGSVVGVLDAAGNWLERTRFGLYGLPEVEAVDTTASILSTVCGDAAGDLRLVFTEPVLPPTTQSATTTIEAGHGSYDDALTVKASAPVSGTWTADSGSPCGINAPAIRFHPDVAIPPGTTVSVVLNTAGLVDRWRNSIETATVSFTAAPGIVYVGPPIGWTASTPSDRSSVGNVLAFQGHLWDADAGLYLARARVLSPVTGAFLSRDPSGFSDSVNMYGALRNDPVNHRDPTGRKLILHGDLSMLVRELAEISGLVLRVCDKDEARRLGCDVGELRSLGIRAPGRGRVSMLAMNILLDAIEDPEVIEVSNAKTIADPKKPGESSAVEFGAAIAPNRRDRKDPAEVGKRTLWDFVAGPIVLDLEDWQYAWGFGWASHTPGLVFLHELTHLAIPYGEERPFADPTKEELKADRWATGRVVDLTNEIATELGLAERLHYQDYRERADPPTTRTLLFSGGRRFQWNRELARSRGPAQ